MQHWSTGGYWDLFGAKEISLKLKTTMWVWFTYVDDSCHPPLSKNHGSMTIPFVPGRSWFKLNKLEENNVMRTFIFQKDMKWLCFLFQGWDMYRLFVQCNPSVQDIIGLCCLLLGLLLSAILSFYRSRTTRQSGFRDETVEFLDRGAGWKSNSKCWIWRCLKRLKNAHKISV